MDIPQVFLQHCSFIAPFVLDFSSRAGFKMVQAVQVPPHARDGKAWKQAASVEPAGEARGALCWWVAHRRGAARSYHYQQLPRNIWSTHLPFTRTGPKHHPVHSFTGLPSLYPCGSPSVWVCITPPWPGPRLGSGLLAWCAVEQRLERNWVGQANPGVQAAASHASDLAGLLLPLLLFAAARAGTRWPL